jgi:hypothetical protein
MSKNQEKARESGSQPADILRIIEDYCEDLGNRAMFRELSIDLENGREAERKAQLEAMEAEVNKLKLVNTQRDMASMMRERKALSARLEEYVKGIEADEDKSVTSDPRTPWKMEEGSSGSHRRHPTTDQRVWEGRGPREGGCLRPFDEGNGESSGPQQGHQQGKGRTGRGVFTQLGPEIGHGKEGTHGARAGLHDEPGPVPCG